MKTLIAAVLIMVGLNGCASAFYAKDCKHIGNNIYQCQEKVD